MDKSTIVTFFNIFFFFSKTSCPTWFHSIRGKQLCVASQFFYIICNIHLNSRWKQITTGSSTVVCHVLHWGCEPCFTKHWFRNLFLIKCTLFFSLIRLHLMFKWWLKCDICREYIHIYLSFCSTAYCSGIR